MATVGYNGVTTPGWMRGRCDCAPDEISSLDSMMCPQHGVEARAWMAGVDAAWAHFGDLMTTRSPDVPWRLREEFRGISYRLDQDGARVDGERMTHEEFRVRYLEPVT